MLLNLKNVCIFRRTYQSTCMCRAANTVDLCCVTRCFASNPSADVKSQRPQIPSTHHDCVSVENQFERLAQVMTPLWQIPYEDQLVEKYKWSQNVVRMIWERIKLQSKGKRRLTVAPKIYHVKPSPLTEEYRNKDEFSIRTGADGNPKTVGFFVGSTAAENVVCVPGTHLLPVRERHKELAHNFEQYIRMSELPTCIDFGPGGGNWRRFVVRSNEEGDTLAVAICHPQSLQAEQLLEEQQRLNEFFTSGPGKDSCPNSLYFQACPHARCTQEQAPFTLLHGEPYLMEKMWGKTFRISPDSFFQVNTKAAEVLYETVLNQAALTPRTTLLDVCCGTGPISILAADHVRGCVGIESIKDAVHDARYNAKINNTMNVDFFYGLAEKRTGKILETLDLAADIVAVVNPGRAGLEPKVLNLLNQCPQITTVVYVSCKADMPSTLKNFVQLLTEGKFTLKKVVPVDLFPHTLHTELVLTFKR